MMLKTGLFISLFFSSMVFADATVDLTIDAQQRMFFQSGLDDQSKQHFSASIEPSFSFEFNENASFKAVVFGRYDEQDSQRTHIDLREFYFNYYKDNLEVKLGYDRVFWGRAEINNVVDVINQKDFVEGDLESRLGQPMFNLSYQLGNHLVEFYTLFGFRERTFAGVDGRLRTPLPFDTDNPTYIDSEKNNIDAAIRFSGPINDYLEYAVFYFDGIDRTPYFDFNDDLLNPSLLPVYTGVEQWGLELEFIHNNLALKLEAVRKNDAFFNYWAGVASTEYNFLSAFGTPADVTLVAEYLWDERGLATPDLFENDIGVATRIAFNDQASSELLLSGVYDTKTSEKVYRVEFDRRLTEQLKLSLVAQLFEDSKTPDMPTNLLEVLPQIVASPSNVLGYSVERFVELLNNNQIDVIDALLNFEDYNTNPTFLDIARDVQLNTYAESKLNFLERDDFVELEFSYSF